MQQEVLYLPCSTLGTVRIGRASLDSHMALICRYRGPPIQAPTCNKGIANPAATGTPYLATGFTRYREMNRQSPSSTQYLHLLDRSM